MCLFGRSLRRAAQLKRYVTMIKTYFDQLITMGTRNKVIALIVFVLLVFLFTSQAEFTDPSLPLIQHKGICGDDTCAIFLFCGWVFGFVLTSKYILMDPGTLGLRQVVVEHFPTVIFLGVLLILFSVIFIGYLVTGKLCLFFNAACLN